MEDITKRTYTDSLLDIIFEKGLEKAVEKIMDDLQKKLVGEDSQAEDESAVISMANDAGQLVNITLSLHPKQPKRAVISCEKGYIEIMEYPRADQAIIVDAENGEREIIHCGSTTDALRYELEDMEDAIRSHDNSSLMLQNTIDVMDIMSRLRRCWNVVYPEEEKETD